MSDLLSQFRLWIQERGPSALVLKEYLQPAALGTDAVIFPPTFAPERKERKGKPALEEDEENDNDVAEKPSGQSGYIIDGRGESNVCILDTVGSQANRMEPIFKREKYKPLVPQILISLEGRPTPTNLLDLGHRAADAFVRSTELAEDLAKAFRDFSKGDALPLAKIAPTTLVFGAWDSRASASGAKVPRLIDSTIRAFDVTRLTRTAQYWAELEPEEIDAIMPGPVKKNDPRSKAGFLDAPSGRTHGGVLVRGDIVRTTIVNFTALRNLAAANQEKDSLLLYILGLALVAALAPDDNLFLRQGCLLVASSKPAQRKLIYRDGTTEDWVVPFKDVEEFAKKAAEEFKVGPDREVHFDSKLANELVKSAGESADKKKPKAKKPQP